MIVFKIFYSNSEFVHLNKYPVIELLMALDISSNISINYNRRLLKESGNMTPLIMLFSRNVKNEFVGLLEYSRFSCEIFRIIYFR